MPKCTSIDPLLTAYVDGEIAASERGLVDEHLRACPPCVARVSAERAVRGLMQAQRAALVGHAAPPRLRERCTSLAGRALALPSPTARRSAAWRARAVPVALAASLVLVVGGAFVYRVTDQSSSLLAAELAADHIKCFGLNAVLGTHHEPSVVEHTMAALFDWPVRLPPAASREGLELVGARRCLYGRGVIAHIMYRHNGHPVSVFMLPKATRREEIVEALGHEAAIWSEKDRTFVLVSKEPRAEVAHVASFVQSAMR